MKKKIKLIKFPLIILMVMVFFSIAEELIIGEGGYGVLLQLPEHRIIRFIIRSVYALIFFILGYKGLHHLRIKWITSIWFLWYSIAIIMVSLRILLNLQFKSVFSNNLFNFFMPFYSLLLTPFPYFFLWMLTVLSKKSVPNS